MNEHAGMGCALSGLIVVVFAVVFHEKERPPSVASLPSPAQARPQPPARPVEPIPTPPATPVQDKTVAVKAQTPPISPRPAPATPVKVVASTASVSLVSLKPEVVEPKQTRPPTAPPVLPSPRPVTPRSSITIIAKGERLVDVAIRVYGSAEATVKLWRANRDRLTNVDEPVSEGWMLRTP